MNDFAADYLAARVAVRTAPTLLDKGTAEKLARSIVRKADHAGVRLDEGTLDEQARQEILSAR